MIITDKVFMSIYTMMMSYFKGADRCLFNSYTMGKRDLPDIYAQARGPQARGRGHIYQENPECPCYN